ALRLLCEGGYDLAADPLDSARLKPRFGQCQAQQLFDLAQIALQGSQRARELIAAGVELQVGDEVFEPRLEGRGVVRPRTFVEQRCGEGGKPALAWWIECGTARKGKPDRHHRQAVVFDEPCLDSGATDHPLYGHRAGT